MLRGKHVITHKDWLLISFNRTITSTWFYHQEKWHSQVLRVYTAAKAYASQDRNSLQLYLNPGSDQSRVTDWPVRLRRKGPPLAVRQTGHFLHPVPGTAAPPPAACWSSSPSPSPLLPVPTLTCSPTEMKFITLFLASLSKHTKHCGLHRQQIQAV